MSADRPLRILIVDDCELARSQIHDVLVDEGYDLQTAADGTTALTMATEQAPDILLLDVRMPEMDGFEVLRRLQDDPRTAGTSVIMVTAEMEPRIAVQALDAGAADFVSKPFSGKVIQARVRHLARQRELVHQLEEAWHRAEQATNSKSEFLANMSHEIRTPMTAIIGYADMLSENVRLPENIHAVKTIRRNGEFLLSILNDILDLAKIEAGKLEIQSTECSPGQMLADVASLMRVRADAKKLSLGIEYDGSIPKTMPLDAMRFKQILLNLTGNAIKFTDHGSVTLVARLCKSDDDETHLSVSVVDTGCGINQHQIEELFRPFNQVDSSATRRFGGSGLGLAICQRLAYLMNGRIEVESEVDKGSRFTLVLPAGTSEDVEMIETPAEIPVLDCDLPKLPSAKLSGRILLAEDGPDNQRLISFLLSKAGADVTVAENGQIALEEALGAMANGTPYDIVLMDMQMPVMDGYTATRKLRHHGYTRPVIALTAHAMSGDRQKCLDAGCDEFATKPIRRHELLQLVASNLNNRVAEDRLATCANLLLTGFAERAGSMARDYESDHRINQRAFVQRGVRVVPIQDSKPNEKHAFPAVTSDLSSSGIGLLAAVRPKHGPIQVQINDEEREVNVCGEIRWSECIGAGFYRIGIEVDRHTLLRSVDDSQPATRTTV